MTFGDVSNSAARISEVSEKKPKSARVRPSSPKLWLDPACEPTFFKKGSVKNVRFDGRTKHSKTSPRQKSNKGTVMLGATTIKILLSEGGHGCHEQYVFTAASTGVEAPLFP